MDTNKRPPAYTQDSAGILQNLRTSTSGLSNQEASRRLDEDGPNELAPTTSLTKKVVNFILGRSVDNTNVKVHVTRNGKIQQINADQLVVGDLVHLTAGDIVPAELRLIETNNLVIQSGGLIKRHDVKRDAEIILPKSSSVDERINMAYSSDIVKKGNGLGIVTATNEEQESSSTYNIDESYYISI